MEPTKDNVLELIREDHKDVDVIYFRSGKNHPWRKYKLNLSAEEKKQMEREKRKNIDLDHMERNMRWWNNYQPQNYQKVVWSDTERDLREIDDYLSDYQ